MEKNVGRTEQAVRGGVGAGLFLWALTRRGLFRWAGLALGSNLVGTAVTQKCGINQLLGRNTFEEEKPARRRRKAQSTVEESSEESFPASDAPSWTMGRG
jgi:hypothetical protein